MKFILTFCFCLFIVSCGKDKVIELPEINRATITEINDVSAAYLFYDEIKPDSTELNRKNLISTTNWLFNVDKRLTLKQAIPKIKFLQEKRRNAQMHKNEIAKNYYTCNDTSRKNLGFIDFTDVVYYEGLNSLYERSFSNKPKLEFLTQVISMDSIYIQYPNSRLNGGNSNTFYTNSKNIKKDLYNIVLSDTILGMEKRDITLFLGFDPRLTFQDYISFKEVVSKIDTKQIQIDKSEFIFN